MFAGKYTLLYEKKGLLFKLCRVWFGTDGSYYVSCPYHPDQKAAVMKIPINYARDTMQVRTEELIDVAALDDDEKRLKLAHHPDGFIQFSGEGILSGKDSDGVIRGMGVHGWPLDSPMRGPAFGLTITNIERFDTVDEIPKDAVVFRESEMVALPGSRTLILEGHYLKDVWRRFVRVNLFGEHIISVVHPARVIVDLKAAFPNEDCKIQGFIGLELYAVAAPPDEDGIEVPSFALTSATGNARRNLSGEIVADGLCAMFPRSTIPVRRVLNYRMNEIPADGHFPDTGSSPSIGG